MTQKKTPSKPTTSSASDASLRGGPDWEKSPRIFRPKRSTVEFNLDVTVTAKLSSYQEYLNETCGELYGTEADKDGIVEEILAETFRNHPQFQKWLSARPPAAVEDKKATEKPAAEKPAIKKTDDSAEGNTAFKNLASLGGNTSAAAGSSTGTSAATTS